MPSERVVLGPYTVTGSTALTPTGPIVGGDGSVDDGSDATYVVMRNEVGLFQTNVRKQSFQWHPDAVDLPVYGDVVSPRVDIRVRNALLSTPSDQTPLTTHRIEQTGPLASYFGPAIAVDATIGWHSLSFGLSQNRWNEFRGGLLTISVSNDRSSWSGFFVEGEEDRIAVYEIEYTIVWDWAATPIPSGPPLRRYPREDGYGIGPTRHYPPPRSRRAAGGYH